jgi:hypothetical protein
LSYIQQVLQPGETVRVSWVLYLVPIGLAVAGIIAAARHWGDARALSRHRPSDRFPQLGRGKLMRVQAFSLARNRLAG